MDSVSVINHDTKNVALHFILCSFGVFAFLYVLFLGNMVSNIIERRSLETEARALSNEVGNLELTYLTMSNDLDLPFSYALGFRETNATFATRKSLGLGTTPPSFNSAKEIQNNL